MVQMLHSGRLIFPFVARTRILGGGFIYRHPEVLFRQFARGLVNVEMLVREMRFKQLTMQYSFHTQSALAALEFLGVDDVY